jgi:hypothetical protein
MCVNQNIGIRQKAQIGRGIKAVGAGQSGRDTVLFERANESQHAAPGMARTDGGNLCLAQEFSARQSGYAKRILAGQGKRRAEKRSGGSGARHRRRYGIG